MISERYVKISNLTLSPMAHKNKKNYTSFTTKVLNTIILFTISTNYCNNYLNLHHNKHT